MKFMFYFNIIVLSKMTDEKIRGVPTKLLGRLTDCARGQGSRFFEMDIFSVQDSGQGLHIFHVIVR